VDFVQDVGSTERRSPTVCITANEAERGSGQSVWAKQSLQRVTKRKASVRHVKSLESFVISRQNQVTNTSRCDRYESVNMDV
jgi:hypothetical protein